MLRHKINFKLLILLVLSVNTAKAMDIGGSISLDLTTTAYDKCQHLADALNSKQELYCSPNATNKEFLLTAIKKQKKKLKKCEKKWRNRYIPISAVQVNFSYQF